MLTANRGNNTGGCAELDRRMIFPAVRSLADILVLAAMSSVHAIRAKQWETNAFIAEWFANAVVYCQSPEGKKAFEAW
jgi:hypothetical protein